MNNSLQLLKDAIAELIDDDTVSVDVILSTIKTELQDLKSYHNKSLFRADTILKSLEYDGKFSFAHPYYGYEVRGQDTFSLKGFTPTPVEGTMSEDIVTLG